MIFDPVLPLSIIIVTSIVLTILFLWLELKIIRPFAVLRVLAVMLLMCSLGAIMLKPKYRVLDNGRVLLLTPGYSSAEVDSLISKHPHLLLLHLNNAKARKNSMLVSDDELPLYDSVIDFVVGEGIPLTLLDKLQHKGFSFIPGKLHEGLTDLSLRTINLVHRKNHIWGTYHNKGGKVRIYLKSPGSWEDSVYIDKAGLNNFQLSFVPRQSGKFTYQLTVRDSATTRSETLPILVANERKLRILFLLNHPTFETQYLKNYLAKKNHSLVLRTQLSKGRYHHQYINHAKKTFRRLTDDLLSDFELVIADASALSLMSPVEYNALTKSVEAGLGVLTLSVADGKIFSDFFSQQVVPYEKDTTLVTIGSKVIALPSAPFRVTGKANVIPVLKNKSGVLSGYSFHAAGKSGFQLVNQTYRLLLSGDSINYAELWTPLLEQIARRERLQSKIQITTPFPLRVNEPVDVQIITSNENLSVTDDSVHLPLAEHPQVDNVWRARTWGGKSGWHSFATSDGARLDYYVHAKSAWTTTSAAQQLRANGLVKNPVFHGSSKRPTWKMIPPVIFYLLFIIAAGFLWVSAKV